MAATASAPLNAEPSVPEERRQQHLPVKSYADAAEEALEIPQANGSEPTSDKAGNGNKTPKSSSKKSKKNENKIDHAKEGEHSKKVVEQAGATYKMHQTKHLVSTEPISDVGVHTPSDAKQSADPGPVQVTELVSGRHAGRGWDDSGIRWAPLNVPLKRRLQTLIVLCHSLSIALFLTAFFLLCAIPLTWPILLPYVIYILFSNAGESGTLSGRSNFLRSLPIWSLFASYFPARLHRTQELPATRKYVLGYHPHGIISHGAFAAFATEALGFSQLFPGITNTLLTLDSNFRIPLYRDYALAMGLASVSRKSCENILGKGGANKEGMGRAVTIVVGGARESLDAQPGSLRLVLKRRKGFVKIAVRAGADLVPVLAFGENELYDQVSAQTHPFVHSCQLVMKKMLGFTVPLFFARGVFNYDAGLLPYRRPVNIVVGRPIRVVQEKQPDPAYVDELHALYIKELERLWNDWKGNFAPNLKEGLEIVE